MANPYLGMALGSLGQGIYQGARERAAFELEKAQKQQENALKQQALELQKRELDITEQANKDKTQVAQEKLQASSYDKSVNNLLRVFSTLKDPDALEQISNIGGLPGLVSLWNTNAKIVGVPQLNIDPNSPIDIAKLRRQASPSTMYSVMRIGMDIAEEDYPIYRSWVKNSLGINLPDSKVHLNPTLNSQLETALGVSRMQLQAKLAELNNLRRALEVYMDQYRNLIQTGREVPQDLIDRIDHIMDQLQKPIEVDTNVTINTRDNGVATGSANIPLGQSQPPGPQTGQAPPPQRVVPTQPMNTGQSGLTSLGMALSGVVPGSPPVVQTQPVQPQPAQRVQQAAPVSKQQPSSPAKTAQKKPVKVGGVEITPLPPLNPTGGMYWEPQTTPNKPGKSVPVKSKSGRSVFNAKPGAMTVNQQASLALRKDQLDFNKQKFNLEYALEKRKVLLDELRYKREEKGDLSKLWDEKRAIGESIRKWHEYIDMLEHSRPPAAPEEIAFAKQQLRDLVEQQRDVDAAIQSEKQRKGMTSKLPKIEAEVGKKLITLATKGVLARSVAPALRADLRRYGLSQEQANKLTIDFMHKYYYPNWKRNNKK